MKIKVKSVEEMRDLAKKICQAMDLGDVFGLMGDLGAGKTTLVALVVESLGSNQEVRSPSFSLAHIYDSNPQVNHLDLYRLEYEEEIESFEFETYFYPDDSISFIEWPLRAKSYLPRGVIYINIEVKDGYRLVTIDDNFFERNDKYENIRN